MLAHLPNSKKRKPNISTTNLERASAVPVREMAHASKAVALHVYLASTATAYGFVINERPTDTASAIERELCHVVGLLPPNTDNFEATLVAAREALQTAQEFDPCGRRVFVHTSERSVKLQAENLPQWRHTGIYLTSRGRPLPKEAAWRKLTEAMDTADVVFLFAENFTAERKRIADLQAELREARGVRAQTSAANKSDVDAFIEEEFGEEIERLMRRRD